jgi:hypothetical protein
VTILTVPGVVERTPFAPEKLTPPSSADNRRSIALIWSGLTPTDLN